MTIPTVRDLAASYWDPPDDDSSDRELALRCSRDLRVFIREAWPILEPGTPYAHTWMVDALCEHLEAASRREIRRLIINIPPRTLKSTAVSKMWPAWSWLTNPALRWMFVSYSDDLSTDHSVDCRTLIESVGGRQSGGTLLERIGYRGVLKLLGRVWELKAGENLKTRYTNSAGGRRLASSVGAKVTGFGGDIIVADDPHNAMEAHSDVQRLGVLKWWDEAIASRMNQPKTDVRVVVMQRLHDRDLTGHLIAKEAGYTHLCLPMEFEPSHPFVWPKDPRTEPGELLWPERFDAAVVDQLHVDLGSSAYAGQYQQRPAPEGGGLFKRGWFTRRWRPDELLRLHLGFDRVIASWDMAFKDTKGSDYVVGQLWGFHGADCYLLAQVRARLDFPATLHAFEALHGFAPHGPMAVAKLVEDKANGTAVIATLRRKVPAVIAIEPQGGKYVRASAVAPRAEAGNVILPAADTIPCPAFYVDEAGERHELTPTTVQDWIHEHASFPAGANDDQVDAFSPALTWANPQPRGDVEVAPPGPLVNGSVMAGVLTMEW